MAKLKARYGFLSDRHARRLVRLYGTKAAIFLGDATGVEATGAGISAGIFTSAKSPG